MYRKNSAKDPYLYQDTMTAKDIMVLKLSFMIYSSYTVPMSLFVMVEVGHAVQGPQMEKDNRMLRLILSERDEGLEGDKKIVHATVLASTFTDEFGVVQHVFTDKTGTLTTTEMTLCSTETERQRARMDETEQAEVGEGELEMMKKQLEVHSGVLAGVEDLSGRRLRTMCVCTRSVGEAEIKEWKTELAKAINSLSDREERIEENFAQLEHQKEQIGCTDVLDRHDDECVPTLEMIKPAGLTVWMLTGDKVNTDVSIGHLRIVVE
ncbi:phospholipid-transporting P-type ATPase [Blattamonas nauphoetae]|uniref:Phospholipid-transporting P-type ATPase n=1 Tax=Blattamonas nauphoetae TaxID=2049346 RepID=A0ABQ9WYN6_9EUKA|nr:phospholipid-transporting P-type ATPase [Blattamonas nauphoetae]